LHRQDAARARLSYCHAILWSRQPRCISWPVWHRWMMQVCSSNADLPKSRHGLVPNHMASEPSPRPVLSLQVHCPRLSRHPATQGHGIPSSLTQRQDRACLGAANLLPALRPLRRHKRSRGRSRLAHRPITSVRTLAEHGGALPCSHTIGLLDTRCITPASFAVSPNPAGRPSPSRPPH
jgi:hypothetical protein